MVSERCCSPRHPFASYSRAAVQGRAADLSFWEMAARGIADFSHMLRAVEIHSPLRRKLQPKEVAGVASFLASDAASAITGQTMFVDCGYSAMGLVPPA